MPHQTSRPRAGIVPLSHLRGAGATRQRNHCYGHHLPIVADRTEWPFRVDSGHSPTRAADPIRLGALQHYRLKDGSSVFRQRPSMARRRSRSSTAGARQSRRAFLAGANYSGSGAPIRDEIAAFPPERPLGRPSGGPRNDRAFFSSDFGTRTCVS
jgi:hypothetical protein